MAVFLLMGLEQFPEQNKVIRRPDFENLAQQSGRKMLGYRVFHSDTPPVKLACVYLFIYVKFCFDCLNAISWLNMFFFFNICC